MTGKRSQRKRARSSISNSGNFKRRKDDPNSLSSPPRRLSPTQDAAPSEASQGAFNFVVDDLHDGTGLLGPLEELTDYEDDDFLEESEDEASPASSPWCRKPENGWLLPGERKDDLAGPTWPGTRPERTQNPLATSAKRAIQSVAQDIIKTWPSAADEPPSSMLSFATPYAFYTDLFEKKLVEHVNTEENTDGGEKGAQEVQDLLKDDEHDVVKQQILEMFRNAVQKQIQGVSNELLARLRGHTENGKKIQKELRDARRSGEKCRTKALWIGLERESPEQVEAWKKKYMVESAKQAESGLNSGAFKKGEYIRVDQRMHRLCAPAFNPSKDGPVNSFIFWTKTSATDQSPTWDKVFGGLVHGLHSLDSKFRAENDFLVAEMSAMAESLKKGASNPLPRPSVRDAGVMVKAAGPHTTNHIPYVVDPPLPKPSKSKKPKASTTSKLAAAKQLRVEMRMALPVIQARGHAFLSGFLPSLANTGWESPVPKDSINRLGYPNFSSFGTFAYCASSHTDKDDSATSGFVMKRDHDKIPRDESNFVWTSHGLVVELNNLSFWFWNAPIDYHGTTMNALALDNPSQYKAFLNSDEAPQLAQWTRVFVMPKSVRQAHLRADSPLQD